MWTRLRALVVKELLVVLRDPRSRAILIAAPVVQLVVFASAATLEVKNVDVAILDRDEGRSGSEVFRRLEGSPTFRSVVSVDSPAALRKAVDHQKVLVGIQLGSDFSREIAAGRTGKLFAHHVFGGIAIREPRMLQVTDAERAQVRLAT